MSIQPYPTLLTLDQTKATTSLSPPRPTTTAIPPHTAPTVSNTIATSTTYSTTPASSSSSNFNHTIHAPKAGRRTSSRQTTLESLLGPTLRLPIPSKANKPFPPEIKDGALRDDYSYSRDGSSGSEDEQDADVDDTYAEDNDDYEYNNGNQEEGEEEDDDGEDDNDVRSKEDPLASQVWKMYSKAKDSLDGQRMENMTWRMMTLSLHKKDTAAQNTPNQPRLVLFYFSLPLLFLTLLCSPYPNRHVFDAYTYTCKFYFPQSTTANTFGEGQRDMMAFLLFLWLLLFVFVSCCFLLGEGYRPHCTSAKYLPFLSTK